MPEETKELLARFEVKDGKIHLLRTTINFPIDDFQNCINLLQEDLDKEYEMVSSSNNSTEEASNAP